MPVVKIAGIVLAAGVSERMEGGPKQLLAFGDRTMVGHVVATAEESSLVPIVVVTGYMAGEVEAAISPRRARFVRNPDYELGNMSSLHAGVAEVGGAEAVMVLLGDQPEVTLDAIETVAATWSEFRPLAAVALYEGVIGHPWVLSAEAIESAASLTGTKALWPWLNETHRNELHEVELARPKPIDVNTRAEYLKALQRLGLDRDEL